MKHRLMMSVRMRKNLENGFCPDCGEEVKLEEWRDIYQPKFLYTLSADCSCGRISEVNVTEIEGIKYFDHNGFMYWED